MTPPRSQPSAPDGLKILRHQRDLLPTQGIAKYADNVTKVAPCDDELLWARVIQCDHVGKE
jgi:hypothetical protein